MISEVIAISVGIIILTALLRIVPILLSRGHIGVDHWYWKLYVETYRRDRLFPPELPQYLLEEHQWYPPIYPLIVAHLPGWLFERFSSFVALSIDLVRLLLLMVAVSLLGGGARAVVLAGLVYAMMPVLVSYNVQLNPRGLGALFLDAALVLILWILFIGGTTWLWGGVILLAALILLTHKMSSQLFWFLCLSLGIIFRDWRLLALIPGSITAAFILSKGFYLKVLRSHWDIVTFWHRNWRWLQAHPVRESTVYGEPGFETPGKFHRKGATGLLRHLRYLWGYAPIVWVLLPLLLTSPYGAFQPVRVFEWTEAWYAATILLVCLTLVVPALKCLGSGYLYLYNIIFPTSLLWALVLTRPKVAPVMWMLFCIALAGSAVSLLYYYRCVQSKSDADTGFDGVVEYLKAAPDGAVMCLPPQPYDAIAYRTGKPVLWGAHGYGVKKLENLFPRLKLSMSEIMMRYRPRYLLTCDGYLPARFIADIPHERMEMFGKYSLYLLSSCD